MNCPTTEFDQVRHFTLITGLIWILFWMFFDFSKHNPALMRVNPFLEDPYDAVGSFGLQLAFLAEMVSLVRIVRPYPKGISSEKILLILNGNGVALVAMAVTLAVDLAAMFRFLPKWVGSADGWILALITGGLLFLTGWAGRLVYQTARDTEPPAVIRPWKRTALVCLVCLTVLVVYPQASPQGTSGQQGFPGWPVVAGGIAAALVGMICLFVLSAVIVKWALPAARWSSEDVLDDLCALYHNFTHRQKDPAHPAGVLVDRAEKLAAAPFVRTLRGWLSPRRHPWIIVLLVGLGMGLALLAGEFLFEGGLRSGLVLTIVSIYLGIEGAGVLLGYGLFRQYLGLFRPSGLTGQELNPGEDLAR